MTTNFALKLSVEGIELLHRVQRGWQQVGVADVEDPKLDSALADLRSKALALEPRGLRTKLIIPIDQIKYLAIDSTLTTAEDVNAAIDGATPYSLSELVIDFEKSGGRTHIAAVAKETLIEAEAFARAHQFNPVAFVAVPEPFTFQKEVFFGPTEMMAEVLGPLGMVERDTLPVMSVGTRIKSRLLVFDLDESELPPTEDNDLATLLAPYSDPPAPLESNEPEEVETSAEDTQTPNVKDEQTDAEAEDALTEQTAPAQVLAAEEETPTRAWVDLVIPEYSAPVAESANKSSPEPAATPSAKDDLPSSNPLEESRAKPETQTKPIIPANIKLAELKLFDAVIPEVHAIRTKPKAGARPSGQHVRRTRRSRVVALTAAPPLPSSNAPPALGAAPSIPKRQPAAQAPTSDRKVPIIIAGTLAASIAAAGVFFAVQGTGDDGAVETPLEASQAEVVTGQVDISIVPEIPQAQPATAPAIFDQAHLGLDTPVPGDVAAQAPSASSAVRTAFGPSLLFAPSDQDDLPDIDQTVPEYVEATPPEEETLQAEVGAPILRGRVLSPDEARQAYLATGVWQRAPRRDTPPTATTVGSVTVPQTVAPVPELALPAKPLREDTLADLSFIAPANPPAPDVQFAIDESGAIAATEQGTVTPEGAVVYAGLPDFTLRLRPDLTEEDLERMRVLAPAPEGVVIIAGTPAVTPPLRPQGIALPAETASEETISEDVASPLEATPGGVALSGLAASDDPAQEADAATQIAAGATSLEALRPQSRPTGLTPPVDLPSNPDITAVIAGIAAEEPATPFVNMTAQAVAQSQRPEKRPENFARVVAAAQARQAATPAPTPQAQPTQTAAVVAPQNYAPVPGGVARAATQEDVIRLREINLIGVYGRANARRALVRLSNGRYVRVEVGSSLDGGQVTAIGEDALNYVKRGRTYALELPES